MKSWRPGPVVFYALFVAAAAAAVVVVSAEIEIFPRKEVEDYGFWMRKGKEELGTAMKRIGRLLSEAAQGVADAPVPQLRRPNNVLLFIGDGMSLATITASRIRQAQKLRRESGEESSLTWEKFPEQALLKTYNVDRQTPDSAGTATALFSGVKTNFEVLGYDARIKKGSARSIAKAKKLSTVLDWGQGVGKRTGLVTTARLTHATPAALYGHSAHREWECDATLKKHRGLLAEGEEEPRYNETLDLARQMVVDATALKANVILGGGLRSFKPIEATVKNTWDCFREDGRDLLEELVAFRKREGSTFAFVNNTEQLKAVKAHDVDHLLGIFSDSHMSYEMERDTNPTGQPSLKEMTLSALSLLTAKNGLRDGFVLVVEGGRIDHAHHDNYANLAVEETLALDDAVREAKDLLKFKGILDDTLIIVTADHSHVMSLQGYAKRGTDIRGLTGDLTDEGMQEPILSYSNGPGQRNIYQDEPNSEGKCVRKELSQEEMLKPRNRNPAMMFDQVEHHGGDDVGLWATGPMSFLFHKTHEQSYVAHVIGYAMCMGPHANHPDCLQHRHPRPSGSFHQEHRPLTDSSSLLEGKSVMILVILALTLQHLPLHE